MTERRQVLLSTAAAPALAVSLLVVSGRLRIDWGYSVDLCDRGTIERLAAAYAASLRELLAHCRTAGTALGGSRRSAAAVFSSSSPNAGAMSGETALFAVRPVDRQC